VSVVGALIVMLPSLVAQPLSEAVMYILGIDMNINSLPVAAVGIGIGIDYGYYVLSRIVEELVAGEGFDVAIRRMFETTGKTVLFTGVSLTASIIFWVFFPMKFQAQMALLLVLLLGFHLMGALMFIPPMVSLFKPRFAIKYAEERQRIRAEAAAAEARAARVAPDARSRDGGGGADGGADEEGGGCAGPRSGCGGTGAGGAQPGVMLDKTTADEAKGAPPARDLQALQERRLTTTSSSTSELEVGVGRTASTRPPNGTASTWRSTSTSRRSTRPPASVPTTSRVCRSRTSPQDDPQAGYKALWKPRLRVLHGRQQPQLDAAQLDQPLGHRPLLGAGCVLPLLRRAAAKYSAANEPAEHALPVPRRQREPADLQGTAALGYRFKDPTKRDLSWAYVPALRRVRAVSPANRSDGFLGSDMSQDDGFFFDGKPEDFDWKITGHREALRFVDPGSIEGKVEQRRLPGAAGVRSPTTRTHGRLHGLAVAGDLPVEVLGLPVEERSRRPGSCPSRGSRPNGCRRDSPHAAQRRHVGPAQIPLGGILEAIAERCRPLQVGGAHADGEELEEHVLRVRWRRYFRGCAS